MATPDPLAELIDTAPPKGDGRVLKLDKLFGDRPTVLESVLRAHDKGYSFEYIAELLTNAGHKVSEGSVRNWVKAQTA